MHELIKLDIGVGTIKLPGWIGIDISPLPGVDIVHDLLDFPWPIADESVLEARCLHVLEHIPTTCMCCRKQKDPLFSVFDEIYRVLVPGGMIMIETPHASSLRAWQDPTHRRAISEETYKYTSKMRRKEMHVEHYDISCDFGVSYAFITDEHGAIQDIRATLTKIK